MMSQAESERYLNVVSVVHGGGVAKYPPSGGHRQREGQR